jgi:carbonic anhydrase/acetyltransferase-like protein (isoleucine patch superfamily)
VNRPVLALLLLDAVSAAMLLLVYGPPAAALLWLHARLPASPWLTGLLLPLGALLLVAGVALSAAVVRLLLPRLKAGRYPFPGHPQAVVWGLHFALMRAVYLPGTRYLFFSFTTLRWLLLRALGARVAFHMQSASSIYPVDVPLLSVGPEAMLAANVMTSGHFIEQGTLSLGPVDIGRGAQLLEGVKVGPDVSIGEYASIGPECRIAPGVRIGEYAHLGMGCLLWTGVEVGDNAVLGHGVTLEAGVKVGEGAVVESGAHLAPKTQVPDGGRYPPRNTELTPG